MTGSDRAEGQGRDSLRRAALAFTAVLILIVDFGVAASRSTAPSTDLAADLPTGVEAPGPISDDVAGAARDLAGCDLLVDGQPLEDRRHLDPNGAPPPEVLYPGTRPAHSGRHFPSVVDFLPFVPDVPVDERAILHNLEHGSVVVWFDPVEVGAAEVATIERWVRDRLAIGFTSDVRGAVFASPSPSINSDKAVALRAWGVALDCDRFDVTVADRFLQDHWGSHGDSPEAHLSPFPAGVLGEVREAV